MNPEKKFYLLNQGMELCSTADGIIYFLQAAALKTSKS